MFPLGFLSILEGTVRGRQRKTSPAQRVVCGGDIYVSTEKTDIFRGVYHGFMALIPNLLRSVKICFILEKQDTFKRHFALLFRHYLRRWPHDERYCVLR